MQLRRKCSRLVPEEKARQPNTSKFEVSVATARYKYQAGNKFGKAGKLSQSRELIAST